MKILHSADWHLGNFPGPEQDGVNLRSLDTKKCLVSMVDKAKEEKPAFVLISGDLFHQSRVWVDRGLEEVMDAIELIENLSSVSGMVVVMRGTPNHDGIEQFNMLHSHFAGHKNVKVITTPKVISTETVDIAVLPGFDRGVFRAKFPGLSKEEENEVFTKELGNILLGLRSQCSDNKVKILMSHYTVPGCNTESGQVQFLTQFEPVLSQEVLAVADFDLVALGHIHRPQLVSGTKNVYYSGAINAMNFNDEGQERGFWIHEYNVPDHLNWNMTKYEPISVFHKTPYREFQTIRLTDTDIAGINTGELDNVAFNIWRFNGLIQDKIVRVIYSCMESNNKAFNKALLEKQLYEDGAFYVSEISPEKIEAVADRSNLSEKTDPEANLRRYLMEKEFSEVKQQEIILKARPIIAEALASSSTSTITGVFEPIEIEVKNYRNYEEEKFSFEDISFCTINGQNGAGKSSLFMDAIVDCLYEEPREGDLTGWINNSEKARSGTISFSFRIGEKIFRVVRTRTKSGKATLNLSELVNEEWEDRSSERMKDTQERIINILGMDSLTFKSCALIMQDQYGLFLQADKESRMTILGNILGLGIYNDMEILAWGKAKDINRELAAKKQTIKIHDEAIKSAGNPREELEEEKGYLKLRNEELVQEQKERDRINLILSTKLEVSNRVEKLKASINTLNDKKASISQIMSTQQQIIDSCNLILSQESTVIDKVENYNRLLEKEKELLSTNAVYQGKKNELEALLTKIKAAEEEYQKNKSEAAYLKLKKSECDKSLERESFYVSKAEEHRHKNNELINDQRIAGEYIRLSSEISKKQSEYASQKSSYEATLAKCVTVINNLKSKTELLENSNCIDPQNARCKFLADAQEAKKKLETYPAEIEKWKTEQLAILTSMDNTIQQLIKDREALGYDAEAIRIKQKEVSDLEQYVKKLENLNIIKEQRKSLQENINRYDSSLVSEERKLEELRLSAKDLEEYLWNNREAAKEFSDLQIEISIEKQWLEKEKQLPVAREKRDTSSQRIIELSSELEAIDIEIADKQLEITKEAEALQGMDELKASLTVSESKIESINSVIKDIQMNIGALNQKIEDISKTEKEILLLQDQVKKLSQQSADYETLKNAFSQDGIPHNIIRSVIPQLTSTANNILGQMTGGKMGIEFVTEKVLKSNSKKEVVTLDIFIEEYGKSCLPYLSKSGGEKVKSSLSVILALAEIKSTSAGIQLGMLFIDEPPFLDGDGIQAYCDALETIQNRYSNMKIMAITHDPTMKARFPQNLDVVKTEQGSKVIFE